MQKVEQTQRLGYRHHVRCPECGGDELVTDPETGEVTCNGCGLVLQEEMLSREPEWRAFTPQEQATKLRVGPPSTYTMYDKGLSTSFQWYTDVSGKTLPLATRLKMRRLQKWNTRAAFRSSIYRNLAKAMSELNHLADKLHIPKAVTEEAALIYRKALEKKLVRGRSISGILAASLYAACRLTRTPRNLRTIVEASTKERKEITRCYRLIQRNLNLAIPLDDPEQYVAQIASKVHISPKTQYHATQLLRQAKERKVIVGKGPVGLAAAAIYIASIMNFEKITQKKIDDAAGVTEVTVRNRYKRMAKDLGLSEI